MGVDYVELYGFFPHTVIDISKAGFSGDAPCSPRMEIADSETGWTPKVSPALRAALLWSHLERWDGLGHPNQYMEPLELLRSIQSRLQG